jgi:hypothetical protein
MEMGAYKLARFSFNKLQVRGNMLPFRFCLLSTSVHAS